MALHDLALSGALVIDAAEMEDAVDYHAVQLREIRGAYALGIRGHSIERNEHVSAYELASAIIEGDYVCIVVVAQKLAIDFNDAVIVAKHIGDVTKDAAMLTRHIRYPLLYAGIVDSREVNVLIIPKNRVWHKVKINSQRYANFANFTNAYFPDGFYFF